VRFRFILSQASGEIDRDILSSESVAGNWSAHFVLYLCLVRVLDFDVCGDLDIAAFLQKIRGQEPSSLTSRRSQPSFVLETHCTFIPALGRKKFFCQAWRVTQIKFGTDGWRAFLLVIHRFVLVFHHDSGRRTGWRRVGRMVSAHAGSTLVGE
jgi:hypothetical protein